MGSNTTSIREMLEGGNIDEQVPPTVKEGEKKKEEVEVKEDKTEETGEGGEGTTKEDDEIDITKEDETIEEPEEKATKEPSLITRIKKEAGGREFLKKHPELEDAYFLKRNYEQVFSSPEEAKDASDKLEYMAELINPLMDGQIAPLLEEINGRDPEAVATLIHNFLPTISEKSPKMFSAIISPVVRNLLAKTAKQAERAGNEDLLLAVRYVNKAIFDDEGVPRPVAIRPLARKNEEVESERAEISNERRSVFLEAVGSIVDPALDAEINRGLDPDNVLEEGLREIALEKVKVQVLSELKNNVEHMRILNSLDKSAKANGYGKEYRQKMAKQVINAAREIIPEVRAKIKKKMFGVRLEKKTDDTVNVPHNSNSGPSSNLGLPFDPDKIDFNKTSVRDALDFDARKVVMKK